MYFMSFFLFLKSFIKPVNEKLFLPEDCLYNDSIDSKSISTVNSVIPNVIP